MATKKRGSSSKWVHTKVTTLPKAGSSGGSVANTLKHGKK
jgi:hypothetical protein